MLYCNYSYFTEFGADARSQESPSLQGRVGLSERQGAFCSYLFPFRYRDLTNGFAPRFIQIDARIFNKHNHTPPFFSYMPIASIVWANSSTGLGLLGRSDRPLASANFVSSILSLQVSRVDRYEVEIGKLRERLNELDFVKLRVEELRAENHLLLETKQELESQLSTIDGPMHARVAELERELNRSRHLLDNTSAVRIEIPFAAKCSPHLLNFPVL